jgi:hypothetical protein
MLSEINNRKYPRNQPEYQASHVQPAKSKHNDLLSDVCLKMIISYTAAHFSKRHQPFLSWTAFLKNDDI